jgi:phosphoglycerate dehydrogenase-like enzyme
MVIRVNRALRGGPRARRRGRRDGKGLNRPRARAGIVAILLTSVPDAERAYADEAFPGAAVERGPLSTETAARHSDARVLCIAYSDRPTPEILSRFPRLDSVVTRSDGFDHLPAAWLRERGLPGYHLGDYAAPSVARFTVAAIVSLVRRVPEAAAVTKAVSWDRTNLQGRDLGEVTVGVLGTGRIGGETARLLLALGATAGALDVAPDPKLAARLRYVGGLDALLAASDVLTIHVPLDESTRGMIGEREIGLLPRGAALVNTARGEIVDQAAVERALESGRLSGYAADVLPGEPRPTMDLERFRRFPNVVLTPHVASYDRATIRERYARAARIARALLDGRGGEVALFRCVG